MKENPVTAKARLAGRIRTASASLDTSATNLFSNVAENRTRHVVALLFIGDGTSRTIDVQFAGETTDTVLDNLNLGPAQNLWLPEGGYDVLRPIVTIEGGSRLTATQSAGSGVTVTAIYWDDTQR